jgi:hypothetical protein
MRSWDSQRNCASTSTSSPWNLVARTIWLGCGFPILHWWVSRFGKRHCTYNIFLARCTFSLIVESNHQDIGSLDKKASDGTLLPLYDTFPYVYCIEKAARESGYCEPLDKRTRLWLLKRQGDNKELFFPNIRLKIMSPLDVNPYDNVRPALSLADFS